MKPIDLRIISGLEDKALLGHIAYLERQKFLGGHGGTGLSQGEQDTLDLCWIRLDGITRPTRPGPW